LAGARKGHFCAERQAWLDASLAADPGKPALLFIHHPPFDVGEHYVGGYRNPEEAQALHDIVARWPQVVGMLCGHVHWPVAREWAGTEARVMPSVAVDVRNGVDENATRGRPVYMLHRVSGAAGLVSEARTAEA
jgi:3',5'-cyclic AMP phosphodiesterase CpdA